MAKLRLGVLGAAGIYEKRVAIPLRYSEFVEPYAVASRDERKAKRYAERWGFPVFYGSYEALLADKNVDFVYIPLPNHLHTEFIKKAADAGKPVICEKPIALTAADAASAVEYCRKKGVPMMEAFMYRFHPQWIRAGEIVRGGEIGDITSVSSFYAYTNLDGNNIRNRVDAGGGCIYDIGCYTVSSARFLFGTEPQRVCCTLKRDAVFKTDALVSAVVDFGAGKTAVFTLSTQLSPYQNVTAVGTGGSLSIEVPFNMYEDYPGHITVKTGIGTRHIKTAAANQYLLEFDAFAKAIENKTPVPVPGGDSVANMAVLDALRASAESGGWEDVKPCPPLH
jgi:predicted dehydrogenase